MAIPTNSDVQRKLATQCRAMLSLLRMANQSRNTTEGIRMNVYIYKAALYCEPCGDAIKSAIDLFAFGTTNDNGDSDTYPQGPYGDGGGEADFANHCDKCFEALNNPVIGEVSE